MRKMQKNFDPQTDDFAASISGSFMGDEYTETYFFCKDCNIYTLEICHDRFLGEEDISIQSIPKEQGDAQAALIRKCPEPWNKKCRCDAHKQYFRGNLD
ncbi:hypothetical protein JW926_07355 [Candidatus Sumerlaeota bacterium]|nr:hypothetical protein [Candidatus Sumerlaeota bacterium]